MRSDFLARWTVLMLLLWACGAFSAWASEQGAASPPTPPQGAPEAGVVAEGEDGFRVTEKDVRDMIDFFSTHTMFQTSEKEYRRYTVQTFLFAREAEKLRLELPEGMVPDDPVQKRLALANAYVQYRLKIMKLEPEAIQSYYRAFPERFLKDPGAEKWRTNPMPFITEEDVLPLSEVASHIEDFIRQQVKKRVEASVFQELMAAYRVAIK
ncbi:MAG: hypothetical protein WHS86_10490 [Desulfosoma sp.]